MEEDCLGCRLVSGGGLIAAGAFIYYQASSKTKFNKTGMIIVSAGNINVNML